MEPATCIYTCAHILTLEMFYMYMARTWAVTWAWALIQEWALAQSTYRTYFIGFRCMPYMQNKTQAGQSIVQASIMTGEDIVYYFVYSNYRFSE